MKNKCSYVLWSGGLDSTYLIHKLLSENPNQTVVAGYVEVLNNYDKTQMELKATEKLNEQLQVMYPNRFRFLGTVYKCNVCLTTNWMPLPQMIVWISSIMSSTPHDANEICVGYVMNDCAISYLSELKSFIKSYSKMLCNGKLPPISFPLSKTNKEEIHNSIPYELKNHVVWCEMPRKKTDNLYGPCGVCIPCKHSPIMERMPKEVYKEESVKASPEEFVETINDDKIVYTDPLPQATI